MHCTYQKGKITGCRRIDDTILNLLTTCPGAGAYAAPGPAG